MKLCDAHTVLADDLISVVPTRVTCHQQAVGRLPATVVVEKALRCVLRSINFATVQIETGQELKCLRKHVSESCTFGCTPVRIGVAVEQVAAVLVNCPLRFCKCRVRLAACNRKLRSFGGQSEAQIVNRPCEVAIQGVVAVAVHDVISLTVNVQCSA